jgi:hypothetical protein
VPDLLKKEAGVQNRHLSESEPSDRRTGEGEVASTTEARCSPRNPLDVQKVGGREIRRLAYLGVAAVDPGSV